jgi:ribosomal protein L11 methyltransferase
VFSAYLECGLEEREQLIAELYGRGTLGIIELASGLRAWFEDGMDIADLVAQYDGEIVREPAGGEDWVRRTQASFPAFSIGDCFWLAPPWNREPTPEGRIRLEINPGAACGTGWHECTQMCLEMLERLVTPGCSVLDVGTGSGILSVAARLLGAASVISCDIDAGAVEIARCRLGTNSLFVGTADAVRTGVFDVVVANISPEVVRALAPEFLRAAKPGCPVIVSGFPSYSLDIKPDKILRRGEWACAVIS